MNIETEMMVSVLKLTREGLISQELIKRDTHVPSSVVKKLLARLQTDGLIYLRGNIVEANDMQRLKLAVFAVRSGADLERVAGFLQWKEFEGMAAIALERCGYRVAKNLRFKHRGRRWEIDIVGCKRPLVLCVDCKHWTRGLHPSTLKKIVDEQVERTKALAESLPSPAVKIECSSWNNARFIPAVLSLVPGRSKFYDNVPIVPVLQLQDFLDQLPAYVDSLRSFQASRLLFRIDS